MTRKNPMKENARNRTPQEGWRKSASLLIALAVLSSKAVISGNIAILLWLIPCSIPSFIGSLFLNPYQEAAYAAFYRDVAGSPTPALEDNGNTNPTWSDI